MHAVALFCPRCGWQSDLSLTYSCPDCDYSLEVKYDYSQVDRTSIEHALNSGGTFWDYQELLPVRQKESIVSLGEGNTPLIPSKNLACSQDIQLFLKDETRNPTLSFKDRPNTVGVSVAKELGATDIAIASTGNGAASLSAYGAKGALPCHVFIPEETPMNKIVQALYHNAEVIKTPGDFSASFQRAKKMCPEKGWANITSTYINPYTMEGDKTIAYELFAQLGRKVPDWIIVPLGAGPMLSGILKGFEELKLLGFCDTLPHMAGVQAEGCAPIIKAFQENSDVIPPWGQCHTVAGAIADPLTGYETDGIRTVHSIRRSEGYGVMVTDEEIMECTLELAQKEAMLVEPASAASIAAIRQLKELDQIRPGQIVVPIITAHGLKDGEELMNYLINKGGYGT